MYGRQAIQMYGDHIATRSSLTIGAQGANSSVQPLGRTIFIFVYWYQYFSYFHSRKSSKAVTNIHIHQR